MTVTIDDLKQPLSRDRVKKFGNSAGAKSGMSYLEGHDVINEMNQVFGFAWSNQVSSLRHTGDREYSRGDKKMVEVSYVCVVQVAVEIPGKDHTYKVQHDGVGGGSSSMPIGNTAEAHEFAAKNAETDALKRACMKLGDRFGLALYDKDQARVEEPYDSSAAKAHIFAEVTKKYNLKKPEAIQHIKDCIAQIKGDEVEFDTLTRDEAAKLLSIAIETTPKETS